MRNKKVSDISGAGSGGAPTSNQPSPRRVVVQPSPRKSSLARELDFAADLGAEFFGLSDNEDQQSEYASPVNAGNQESVRLRVKPRVRLRLIYKYVYIYIYWLSESWFAVTCSVFIHFPV